MSNSVKLIVLTGLALLLTGIYLFVDLGTNWEYILGRRSEKVIALVVTGTVIAFSTIIFQTITNNRILTPSVIGLDRLYLLTQTFIIFVFGSTSTIVLNENLNFLLCVVLMVLFASLLFKILFKRQQNIYFLLLVGLVFGTFFESISEFMQVLIDPNEFLIIQNSMFASFNSMHTNLLVISIIIFIAATAYSWRYLKYLDVLSLGKEQAVNLGVDYDFVVKRLLIVIAVLVSVSTALVGPITFLGLLVANIAHEFFKTYKHTYLIIGSILISIVALIGGQMIVERVFTFSTTLSVIINFVGGVYFIYLLLKENKSW
ncbi:iron chelate uptake ABC transporter family permease subunit [Radiobacillus kanasensis]|uniref:iron chelate uptake ABC transporter family permease subunit n=1 Tax=Radiobacillus kanasensis TaxID=2844358 RepID=UPI001E3D908B|nr:iron chelate uptake ABC transporter family permease subunit [Radiobacillus kanasensis]UFT98281.1 iron chelate uptake ABC transporter family permease subunit [Radiobacillus kanasensis]